MDVMSVRRNRNIWEVKNFSRRQVIDFARPKGLVYTTLKHVGNGRLIMIIPRLMDEPPANPAILNFLHTSSSTRQPRVLCRAAFRSCSSMSLVKSFQWKEGHCVKKLLLCFPGVIQPMGNNHQSSIHSSDKGDANISPDVIYFGTCIVTVFGAHRCCIKLGANGLTEYRQATAQLWA